MISLAHIAQGDAVRNTTLSRTLPGALTKAFISEWIQPQLPGTAESQRLGDRKSTRLNSSHSQISYAVFCLKKKNTSSSGSTTWNSCAAASTVHSTFAQCS